MTDLVQWRTLANIFPCFIRMAGWRWISMDFTPETLAHQQAFAAWVDRRTVERPLRYFSRLRNGFALQAASVPLDGRPR